MAEKLTMLQQWFEKFLWTFDAFGIHRNSCKAKLITSALCCEGAAFKANRVCIIYNMFQMSLGNGKNNKEKDTRRQKLLPSRSQRKVLRLVLNYKLINPECNYQMCTQHTNQHIYISRAN